jgi:hypothetical protein
MMKARLAKKLVRTPIDRLAPYWIEKFVFAERRDARFEKAFAKWNKRNNDKQVINKNI